MIHFMGTSYAAVTLKEGARRRGLKLTDNISEAELIFVSEDTPTNDQGDRDLVIIRDLIKEAAGARRYSSVPIVVTSQVPPGFMRDILLNHVFGPLYHQAETLRIEDGLQRAMYPEMFIVGSSFPTALLLDDYQKYLNAFDCPVFEMSYDEAIFCKIAINATLISQVETTNLLSAMAHEVGADWGKIAQALRHDSRIGKYSYLTPGRWQNSKHLLRDFVTLNELYDKDHVPAHKLLDAWK